MLTIFCLEIRTICKRMSHFWVLFRFRCVVMDPRFINSNIMSQKLARITLVHIQILLTRSRTTFFLNECDQKRQPSCSQILMPENSCKMWNTRSFEIFTMSLISGILNRRSPSTISWILSIIFWEVTSFGCPDRSASFVP